MNDTGFSIDTSSLTSAPQNLDECRDMLVSELQPILNKVFYDNWQKQQIVHKKDSINFACPFCRDSASSSYKKRAHLILNGQYAGTFKCFNCGASMKFHTFFSEFDKQLPIKVVNGIRMIEDQASAQSVNSSTYQMRSTLTSEVINTSEAKKYAVNRGQLKSLLNLKEISEAETPDAYKYLRGRNQPDLSRFLYSVEYQQVFLLNLVDHDSILGLQMRDLSGKAVAKYKTLTCSKIHKLVLQDHAYVPEQIEMLSTIFNIFNINLYKPIIVTEGAFDAYLLPNAIATAGANKNFGVELPFWYLYDSDQTGRNHAVKKMKEGYKVFLWKKLQSVLGFPDREKWDVTDVYKWLSENNMKMKIRWHEYFSQSSLDGLYL